MERHVTTVIKDGIATTGVYCLKTDSWSDHLAFMEDAEAAMKQGRARDANRFLRAALTCLFSHVEGVLNDICQQRPIPRKRQSLCKKAQAVALAAAQHAVIPFVNFRFEKHLRDLVAHPGITKAFSDPRYKKNRLDQDEVFERLSIDTLRRLEQHVSPWLDAVCSALNVERFTDTKREMEKWMPLLSAMLGPNIEIEEV